MIKKLACLALLAVLMAALMLAGCAKAVSVEFYVNDALYETQAIGADAALTAPQPALTGYAFAGWYASKSEPEAYDFSALPTKNLSLYAKFLNAVTGEETFDAAPLAEDAIVAEYESFGDYGKVLAAAPLENGVYIVTEGYYGYHMEDNPSMTMGVVITDAGVIANVIKIGDYMQTDGFAQMMTGSYLEEAYAGANSAPTLEVEPLTGATVTSTATLYAVQTAAYYAQNVYGYVADTNEEDKAELGALYAAQYQTISTDYAVDSDSIGTVLYAAQGATADGTQVVAMKVRSAKHFNQRGSAATGWDAAEPLPYTMSIVIDKATNRVIAWGILTEGVRAKEYFTVPKEKIDAYMAVDITSEGVFDSFEDGLVFDLDVDTEVDGEGMRLITGTSIVYTGATQSGTFSSQLVRNCFRTAAYFYCNY